MANRKRSVRVKTHLTEKELHEIMNAYGMTEPGISGKELLV